MMSRSYVCVCVCIFRTRNTGWSTSLPCASRTLRVSAPVWTGAGASSPPRQTRSSTPSSRGSFGSSRWVAAWHACRPAPSAWTLLQWSGASNEVVEPGEPVTTPPSTHTHTHAHTLTHTHTSKTPPPPAGSGQDQVWEATHHLLSCGWAGVRRPRPVRGRGRKSAGACRKAAHSHSLESRLRATRSLHRRAMLLSRNFIELL